MRHNHAVRAFIKAEAVPRLLRRFHIAPAPASGFLSGQRMILMNATGITHVIDVGANIGHFVKEIRLGGFAGRCSSFEPGGEAFLKLREAAAGDPTWDVYEVALSDTTGTRPLYNWTSEGSEAASLRPPVEGVKKMLGEPQTETVETVTLESWLEQHPDVNLARALLKIDVQGSEMNVLLGAGTKLREFPLVQIEAALSEWYRGAADLPDILTFMSNSGFRAASVMTERFHRGWLGAADVDVLFLRQDLSRVPR